SRTAWLPRLLAAPMAEVTAGGIRFHVQRLPAHSVTGSTDHPADSPTVVFVHGLGIDNMSSFYYTLANPAARAGADVILYDLRGHGDTERPPTGYSLDASVCDLTALLDALEVTGPVHLVGNSFGGMVALAVAMAHPVRVASLLLIEALTEFAAMTEDWEEQTARVLVTEGMQFRRGLSGWRAQYGRKHHRFNTAIDALVNGTTLVTDLQAQRSFRSADLRSVTCPVLAVYGDNSDILHHAHRLKHLLPNCDLTVVPNCSHFLVVEAPGVLRDLLLRWLSLDAETHLVPVEKALVR
ncbi:MAG: alpha/beta hydrolase, partial [Actinobacteria bacterium]|nr:alpha/beta hydrolase [Actinomycetota bacterium]